MTSTVLALVLFAGFTSPAAPPDRGPGGRGYSGASGELSVATPAVDAAKIRIDGRLDDAAWNQAALLHSFTQYQPVEGVPASQKTEVLVLVDKKAIYFAVRAFDTDARDIRATMSERDAFERSDDYVRFVLDTFNDRRRAYVFTVNPLGVQQDGIWNEGSGGGRRRFGPPIDSNPDFLWSSAARITDWGYAVEVRIPFKSLRFPKLEEQSWGLQVIRRIQRSGFEQSWAPLTGNVANRLAQSGELTGLKKLNPGLFMEINPVLTGKRIGAYDDAAGALVHDNPEGDFGMNMTYGITSNLTLDGTYNPDFSQVEADAGQIAVNERFALFFPEKRPFFLEGTEIFAMPKQIIYTRSIANPIGGAKLTGKLGSLNVGYLGAIDRSLSGGNDAVVNLLRVRRDVGGSSTVGAVYTDRTVTGDDYNRVAGADARLVFARRYTLTLLGAASRTRRPDGTDGPSTGALLSARLERAGRAFSYSGEIEDTDNNFRAGSGFFRRLGQTQVQSQVRYNWYGKRGSLLERVGPSLEFKGYWDHDDFWAGRGVQEAEVQAGGSASFRNNITLWGNVTRSLFSYDAAAYEGLMVQVPDGSVEAFRPDQALFDGLYGATVFLWVNSWQRVRGNVRFSWKEVPIFDRSYGVAVEPGDSYSGNLSLNLYPTRSLLMEIGLRHTTINRKRDGSNYSTATIPRIRAQYQFSRSFFIRGIFEYSTQERGRLLDPSTGGLIVTCDDTSCTPRSISLDHNIHVEGLLTYEPSPGTVFYIGYTREMDDPERFGFRNARPTADGLFVKLSYRFRM